MRKMSHISLTSLTLVAMANSIGRIRRAVATCFRCAITRVAAMSSQVDVLYFSSHTASSNGREQRRGVQTQHVRSIATRLM